MRRLLVVLILAAGSLFAAPAAADTPGPQSKCQHQRVYWSVHRWDFAGHYNTQDWYGNWRHVHVWDHYETPSMAHNYYYFQHRSTTYC